MKATAGTYTAYAICTGAAKVESPEGEEKESSEKEAAEVEAAEKAAAAGK